MVGDIIKIIRGNLFLRVMVIMGLVLIGYNVYGMVKLPEKKRVMGELERKRGEIEFNLLNGGKLGEDVEEMRGIVREYKGRMMRRGEEADNLRYLYSYEGKFGVKIESHEVEEQVGREVEDGVTHEKVYRMRGIKKEEIGGQLGKGEGLILSYKVRVVGGYSGLMMFMNEVQQGRYIGRVREARIYVEGFGEKGVKVVLEARIDFLAEDEKRV